MGRDREIERDQGVEEQSISTTFEGGEKKNQLGALLSWRQINLGLIHMVDRRCNGYIHITCTPPCEVNPFVYLLKIFFPPNFYGSSFTNIFLYKAPPRSTICCVCF